MRISRTIRLLSTFYKSFLMLSVIILALSVWLLLQNGITLFAGIFWLKVISVVLTFYHVNTSKRKEYYYYHNAGISKAFLWGCILIFDFLLFLIILIITYNIQ